MNYSKEECDEFKQNLKLRIYTWCIKLVKYLRSLPDSHNYGVQSIIDQVMRLGTSVGANYVEAINGTSTKDFRNFMAHALKSSNESKFWFAFIRDSNIDNSDELHFLLVEVVEISNTLGKSVSTMYKK